MIDEQRQQIVLSALREASEKWKEALIAGMQRDAHHNMKQMQ